MIDIKTLRDDAQKAKELWQRREINVSAEVDRILALDAQRRDMIASVETDKAEQNKVSKQIPQMKKAGEDTTAILATMNELKEKIRVAEVTLREVEDEYNALMDALPNLPDDDLAAGGKENNEAIRYFGDEKKFDFAPQHHVDLCTKLGLIDYERGTKLAGSGFWIYSEIGRASCRERV